MKNSVFLPSRYISFAISARSHCPVVWSFIVAIIDCFANSLRRGLRFEKKLHRGFFFLLTLAVGFYGFGARSKISAENLRRGTPCLFLHINAEKVLGKQADAEGDDGHADADKRHLKEA